MNLPDRLRRAGRRVTRPRLAVYRALQELGGHRSADDIGEHIGAHGQRLPRASVYNSLEVLREAGLVMMADVGPGRTLYEAADTWHHHFVCRHCGVVVDVGCLRGMKPCLEAELPGTFIDEAQVIFRGACGECATGVAGA